MHWDFYTLLSVLSGIVLIAASLAGPAVGTARERLSIFAAGAFSFIYGIWVATQTSGDGGTGIALWSLPLRRFSSVSVLGPATGHTAPRALTKAAG